MDSDSKLTLAEAPAGKDSGKKYKVLCVVLLALLVIVTLGLGLGLGLRKSEKEEQGSCRRRCFEAEFRGLEGCHCDKDCKGRGDCCWDFENTCVEPTRIWTCNLFRCGERRLENSLCSCANDCQQVGDCCTNYASACQGRTPWVKAECNSSQEPQCPEGFEPPPVILFSMDGFRAEYLDTWSRLLPNVKKLKTCGIHSKYMRSMYPTKTFPNHYTIVTGLYPESHGIIDNNMYDVTFNKNFSLSSTEKNNPKWWGGQPIWLTAKYQGLKTASYFWPGSDVRINDSFPTFYKNYNGSIPYEERITTLLKWLDLPKAERPSFYTIYVEEPDSAGHSNGPVSAGVIQALLLVDEALGMLMEGLAQRNLHNCVNLIVLADHGMDQTYCDKVEYMTDYFSQINFYMYTGPAPRIRARNIPQDFYTFDSEEIVRNLSCRRPDQHFKPYLSPDLPKRLHYARNVRIDRAQLLVERQWLAARSKASTSCGGGTHGYDNNFKSMEAIFLAHGSSFKENLEIEPFENIELYNLMCDLLRIQPAPNNGTHGSLNHLLKKPFYEPSHPQEVAHLSVCGFTASLPMDTLNCSCPQLQNDTQVESMNQLLNLTQDEITVTVKANLPFGKPRVIQENQDYCLLYHREYISGFAKALMMPLWSSYTVPNPGEDAAPAPPALPDCLRADVRVAPSDSQNCSLYFADSKVTHGFLYPPEMWDYFHSALLVKYATERNGVNVVSGPIFDYNYDGHFDSPSEITEHLGGRVPLPTHYFVVLTSCKNRSSEHASCPDNLDVLPFIIPHRPTNVESCPENKTEAVWVEERFKAHIARVRDVELLTGLDFYQETAQPVSKILQLKTYLPTFETNI
ncbi:ectonucleotide pyrophosphatase/phosphodiesterase family member 3 isoform X2 [Cavia porcellus]|uniref:ectonucleotide pyrophosphatase/phosphodiesterase family member 3 isoform X2 n=1 Tax=Cavia porcellus TaxID=10141 RepID=UPI002FDF94E9